MKSPTFKLGCGNVGMTIGVSCKRGGLQTLMIWHPSRSTHNHSVSDCSEDWSTSDHSNRSWTNVTVTQPMRSCASLACAQWVSCRTMMNALFLQASCSMTVIVFVVSPRCSAAVCWIVGWKAKLLGTLQDSVLSSPTPAPTLLEWPFREQRGSV